MTSWPASHYKEMQRRVRELLNTLAAQLPAATIEIVDEMIDANECGVALEIISEMLVESEAVIPGQILSEIASLVDEMGLNRLNVDRLRPHTER